MSDEDWITFWSGAQIHKLDSATRTEKGGSITNTTVADCGMSGTAEGFYEPPSKDVTNFEEYCADCMCETIREL